MPVNPSVITIDLTKDSLIDEFGHTTLKERYLTPEETSPQQAFARAAAAFADDAAHAQRLYDYVSNQWFMFATPLLSNGGTSRGLPISCFLTAIEDSRESLSAHFDEVMWLSSVGGGIGSYYGNLREQGSTTSKGSASTGIIPFAAVDDRMIMAFSQGTTRRGSHAIYLDVHHPEIREFIIIRKPGGGDANRRALNLHNGINVTDEFLARVKDGKPFPLRSPKDGSIVAWDNARELWTLILETRKQTGEPYLFNVDEANRRLPEAQKKLGLKITHSNLCVGPDTEILTDKGYFPIAALNGKTVKVWNGEQFSQTTIAQTAESAELVRVWFEDGGFIDCTPYHKFYDEDGNEIRAGTLKPGTSIERADAPKITRKAKTGDDIDAAYAAGWATFMGFEEDAKLAVFVPELAGREVVKRMMTHSINMVADLNYENDLQVVGHKIRFERKSIRAGTPPLKLSDDARMAWLGGALDAAADWIVVDNEPYLCMGTPDRNMILAIRTMALELGFLPTVRLTDTLSALMLHASEVAMYLDGYSVRVRDYEPTKFGVNPAWYPVVADVQPLALPSATYCFTEPLRHRGTFGGYLTGQCTEITLATGKDHLGKKRTAVCCLSSVNAERADEWMGHPTFIEDLMRMLDNVLDDFIAKAPPGMRDSVYSASMERSVGLGLLGFHSYLQKHMIPFESERARLINSKLFKHLRRKSDAASLKLGAERGEAPDMVGTGHRFAHRMAVAPNASTSILCGNTSPSVEPWRANVFLQKTLSGSYPQKNPWLVKALVKYDLNTPTVWKKIIEAEGSVQTLDQPQLDDLGQLSRPSFLEEIGFEYWEAWETIKNVFKTADELEQRWLIQHAIDRTYDIDQAQSINLFYPAGSDDDQISRDHYFALTNGVKSLYYLRSTAERRAENVNKSMQRIKTVQEEAEDDLGALVSSAMIREEEACISCQG